MDENFISCIYNMPSYLFSNNMMTFLTSFLALIVSYRALNFSKTAVSISLFNARFNLYSRLVPIIYKLSSLNEKILLGQLYDLKEIRFEAVYLFGSDIINLIDKLIDHTIKTNKYYSDGEAMGRGEMVQNLEKLHDGANHYNLLSELCGKLLSENNEVNFSHYFNRYLHDSALKSTFS